MCPGQSWGKGNTSDLRHTVVTDQTAYCVSSCQRFMSVLWISKEFFKMKCCNISFTSSGATPSSRPMSCMTSTHVFSNVEIIKRIKARILLDTRRVFLNNMLLIMFPVTQLHFIIKFLLCHLFMNHAEMFAREAFNKATK